MNGSPEEAAEILFTTQNQKHRSIFLVLARVAPAGLSPAEVVHGVNETAEPHHHITRADFYRVMRNECRPSGSVFTCREGMYGIRTRGWDRNADVQQQTLSMAAGPLSGIRRGTLLFYAASTLECSRQESMKVETLVAGMQSSGSRSLTALPYPYSLLESALSCLSWRRVFLMLPGGRWCLRDRRPAPPSCIPRVVGNQLR